MANPFAGGLLTADAIGGAGELSHPHHHAAAANAAVSRRIVYAFSAFVVLHFLGCIRTDNGFASPRFHFVSLSDLFAENPRPSTVS